MQERHVIKQHITHTLISGAHLTRGGLADGGVVGAELEAVHAEAVEAAVGVDAALGTRVGGHALVDVHARLPVALQLESRMTPALKAARAKGGEEKSRTKNVTTSQPGGRSHATHSCAFRPFQEAAAKLESIWGLFVCKFQPGKSVKCRRERLQVA